MSKIVFQEEMRVILEGTEFEDGGRAAIINVDPKDENEKMFVRIQSWDEEATGLPNRTVGERRKAFKHEKLRTLMSKNVRVTIEIIGED